MMKHGVKVDMKPSNLGGDGSLYILMKNIFHFGGIMKRCTIVLKNLLKRNLNSSRYLS